jgi:hypothetical protein
MDSDRARRWLVFWVVLVAAPCVARGAAAPEKFSLKSVYRAGELSRVEVAMQVGGDVKLVTDGKSKTLPMSVVANLKYDERLMALGRDKRPVRAIRYYDDARAAIKVDKGGEKPTLGDRHRLIVVDKPEKSAATLFCPTEALFREELDLIDVPGNTLVMDRLLPAEAVALGESWKPTDQVLADLLGLEAVSWADVECMLGEVKDGVAAVSAAGSLSGAVGGVSTEIELKIKYKFNLKSNRITLLALLIKEKRSVGHVGPGLDTVAKVIVTIAPIAKSENLTAAETQKLPQKPTPELSELSYLARGGRFRFNYDRRWYLTSEDPKLSVWRLLDRGELVAQCNMSPLPAGKKPATLAEFQRDVQNSLGKNFGQFVRASQNAHEAGYTVFRLVVHGSVSQLPIEWIYYLIQDEKGQAVSLAFTFERDLSGRFAEADRSLVSGLRLGEPQSSTAAKPTKAR